MRLLVFSLAYHPFVGGAEVALQEIMRRLPQHDFHVVTLHFDTMLPSYEAEGDNIHIHRVGFASQITSPSDIYKFPHSINKYLFPFFALRKAVALHREHSFDLSWAIMANYAGFAALFFKLAFRSVPYLLTMQEGDPYITNRKIKLAFPFFRRIFLYADRIHAISSYLAQTVAGLGYAGPVDVVPNGVDTSRFAVDIRPQELEALKHELQRKISTYESTGERQDEVTLVSVSRLVRKNGISDLIEAMSKVPENVRLLVVGTGPDLLLLKMQVSTAGLDGRVIFTGAVPHADVPKYLKVSNIFVRPSLSEGFGNSFIEAMAAGIPVIATPVGGIVDFVFDPVRNPDREPTGFLCDPGNPESVAEKIKIVMESPELTAKIVENARALALCEYDWHHIAERMDEVFEACAGKS